MKIKDLYKKYQTLFEKEVELQGWIKIIVNKRILDL